MSPGGQGPVRRSSLRSRGTDGVNKDAAGADSGNEGAAKKKKQMSAEELELQQRLKQYVFSAKGKQPPIPPLERNASQRGPGPEY